MTGDELREKELTDGRVRRASEIALDLCHRMEEMEVLTRILPNLISQVKDLCRIAFDSAQSQQATLASVFQQTEVLYELMKQVNNEARDYRDGLGKLREMRGTVVACSDTGIAIAERIQAIGKCFETIFGQLQAVNMMLDPVAQKARLEALLAMGKRDA